jgi:hypothetical protein
MNEKPGKEEEVISDLALNNPTKVVGSGDMMEILVSKE